MEVKIVGNAYVVTSSITKKDFDVLKKSNPDALKIKDENGNDVFTIAYSEGSSVITSFGVTFSGTDRNGSNKLTFTGAIPSDVGNEDVKDVVADLISLVKPYIEKLEETVPEETKKVEEARKKLIESITIA